MNPKVRRKLTAFLLVVVIMGGVLVYAETIAPNLLDFPNAILNIMSIDTGQGAGELYGMDQDIKTSDAVTFATIDTGQGANELYDMDQNVQTTDEPTFQGATVDWLQIGAENRTDWPSAGGDPYDQSLNTTDAVTFTTVDTGQGANELYDMDQNVQTTDEPTFQGATVGWIDLGGDNRTGWPSGGVGSGIDDYSFTYHVFKNATSTYAINGTTGAIDYSGADVDVIQSSYDTTSTSGGGDLVLSPGSYTINKRLNLTKKYVEIKGTGQVAVTGSSNTVRFTISSDTSYVYINTTDIAIERILFYGHWDTGIEEAIRIEDTGTNIDNVQITYCRFRGFKKGIHFLNAFGSGAGNLIGWCSFDGPASVASDGIYGEDLSHWTFQDDWFNIREVANSSGMHFVSSGTEGYPHTERIVLINTGFNGFNTNNITAIKLNITRPSDSRGELDGFTMIGGYIENCWTGVWVISDGGRATMNFLGTQFFSAYTHNIKVEPGQDDTYIVADNCYQLDTITNEGGAHITVSGEWVLSDPQGQLLPYLRGTTFQGGYPGGQTPTASATRWTGFSGRGEFVSTEARVELYLPKGGILRNLRIRAIPHATEDATYTLRLNGEDTAITFTITAGGGEAEFTDTTHVVEVDANDRICGQIVTGTGSPVIYRSSIEYCCG